VKKTWRNLEIWKPGNPKVKRPGAGNLKVKKP